MSAEENELRNLFKLLFQAHPWHGVSPGAGAPEAVNAYIEIVPTDAWRLSASIIDRKLAR